MKGLKIPSPGYITGLKYNYLKGGDYSHEREGKGFFNQYCFQV